MFAQRHLTKSTSTLRNTPAGSTSSLGPCKSTAHHMRIKLVLFDAFDTIVTPRLPVHVQYASVFAPYFTLDPAKIKPSFKKGSYFSSYNKKHLAKLSKHSSKCKQNSRHMPVDLKAFRGPPMAGGGKSLSVLL